MNLQGSLRAWVGVVIAPALMILAATYIAASTWERVRTRPEERTIRVTGSAKQRIVSDLIEWDAVLDSEAVDRTEAYRTLRAHLEAALTYLDSQGIARDSVRASSVAVQEMFKTEYVGSGEERIQRRTSIGWRMTQGIAVRSNDVDKVERVSREITQLLESGVSISSNAPRYYYTKLGELKIDMLARASSDARERAAKIVGSGGNAELGKLWTADMGVINVNPVNSTDTSWEGNNDTSSLEKDIITIVHLTFELP